MSDPSATSNTSQLTRPLLFSRFQVMETLGKGASGHVYRVVDTNPALPDTHPEKEVALKILDNATVFDDNGLIRFREEIEVCRQISHPNLVKAYQLVEGTDGIAYTMELVRGDDLANLLGESFLTHDRINSILQQLLAALSELHKHNIIHRDIKLENIMVNRKGEVKLTDLGLIRRLDKAGITKTGILLGTPQYMPPEYVKDVKYDARGDVYAVGVVLYELLTGRRYLLERNGAEALDYIIKQNFKLPALPAAIPSYLRNIIEKATAYRLSKRFQSAAEMSDALASKQCDLSEPINTQKKWVVPAAVGGLIIAAIIALMYYMPSRPAFVPVGKYTGQLDNGAPIDIDFSLSGETHYISGLRECPSGRVGADNMIKCLATGFYLDIKKVDGSKISGVLRDTRGGRTYLFVGSKI